MADSNDNKHSPTIMWLTKQATVGGISGAVFHLTHMGKGTNINVRGYNLPLWLFAGAIGMSASIFADMVNSWMLPHINSDKSLQTVESSLIQLGASGGFYVLASEFLAPGLLRELSVTGLALTGAIANVLGEYVVQRYEEPLLYGDPEF